MTPLKTILLLMLLGLCGGCTVVSANRTFPKLDWYWSKDAQEQRRENAQEKADNAKWQAAQTNAITK